MRVFRYEGTDMIQINKYRFSIIKSLYGYTNGIRSKYVILLIISLISVTITFIEPVFYRTFINDVVMDAQRNKLTVVAVGYITVFFINTVIGYSKYHISYTVKFRLRYNIKAVIFKNSLLYKNLCDNVGDIKIRIEDDSMIIEKFADAQSVEYLFHFIKVITCLILLVIIEWRLIFFTLITIPLTIWLDLIISKKEKQLNGRNIINEKNMYNWLTESLRGWREIRKRMNKN